MEAYPQSHIQEERSQFWETQGIYHLPVGEMENKPEMQLSQLEISHGNRSQ